jgi:hypothetical protein
MSRGDFSAPSILVARPPLGQVLVVEEERGHLKMYVQLTLGVLSLVFTVKERQLRTVEPQVMSSEMAEWVLDVGGAVMV